MTGSDDAFMAWQCLIRQHAMRREGGRPSDGMAPLAVLPGGTELGRVLTVILQRDPAPTAAVFAHAVRSTHDPRERFEKGLKVLSSTYFQKSAGFEPRLFAQFSPRSSVGRRLVEAGRSTLRFEQFSQTWRLPCLIRPLAPDDPFARALYWHNALFGPPPATRTALAFEPVWSAAQADPPIDRA